MPAALAWLPALVVLSLAGALQAQEPPPAPPGASQTTPQAPSPATPSSVLVLDPAHGGADAGARGPSGVIESEAVLALARAIHAELERQGLRVVLTRQGSENPSFDDRSAVANGQRGAVFVTLHVSTTGPVGTVRAYYYLAAPAQPTPAERATLPSWDRAQEPYLELSGRFAELVQVGLAQKFRGSPEVPSGTPVRQLRTVAAPAVAVEISSVAVPDGKLLEQMAPVLAEVLARAVAAFQQANEGTK